MIFKNMILSALAIVSHLSLQVSCGAWYVNNQRVSHSDEQHDMIKQQLQGRQITVHLIPHTHDDVGWLKTVDGYFSGSKEYIDRSTVKMVLETTIPELLKDPSRRFTYVEMKFFSMWWRYQTDETKEQVRQLVKEGRLEFINGGWSMHDEACTHYEDMINNMHQGHQFLLQEFGITPKIGWQIDPFGHSQVNPRLFAEMGFEGWFFSRMDRLDKYQRNDDKALEFIWQPQYQHLGDLGQIYTHAFFGWYGWPDGFDYDDRLFGSDPIVTDPDLETFNADQKMNQLLKRIYDQLNVTLGDHLFIPYGCDFSYSNAIQNFGQSDRLIKYFNDHSENITLQYSTPSMFLDAIKKQNQSYPVNYYDLFPYSDDYWQFWTGYYTSRANSKKYIRDLQTHLAAAQKIYAMRVLDQHTSDDEIKEIFNISRSLLDIQGVMQHHDAITGTAKQYVANDYDRQIHQVIAKSKPIYSQVIDEMIQYYSNISSNEWQWCERLNGTYIDCPISKNGNDKKDFIFVAHNPSLYDYQYAKVKVSHGNYEVNKWNISTQQFDKLSTAAVICAQRKVESGIMVDDCDLHIKTTLNASSFTIFQIQYNTSVDIKVNEAQGTQHIISSNYETLIFSSNDTTNGVNFELLKGESGQIYKLSFDFKYYIPQQRGGEDRSSSGAYIFAPDLWNQSSFQYTQLYEIKSYNGGFVQEITMNFTNQERNMNAFVIIRYYDQSPVSEWEVYLSEIPLIPKDRPVGKEIIVTWKSSNIANNKTFYTDSNGLEMQKRVLYYRPTFQYFTDENISANYYPINSAIAIVDEAKGLQMTVMNDRSQGGSAIEEGRIELMQNRRLIFDDERGVNEALNETDKYGNGITVPATYRLEFLERNIQASSQRQTQIQIDEPLQYFFTFDWNSTTLNNIEYQPHPLNLSALINNAAFKYFVLPLEKNKFQIRLENIGDRFDTDYKNLSINDTTIVVPLDLLCQKIFDEANHYNSSVKLANITYAETSITGNQEYLQMKNNKFQWNIQGNSKQVPPGSKRNINITTPINWNNVELEQQRIRTFNVTFTVAEQEEQIQKQYYQNLEEFIQL